MIVYANKIQFLGTSRLKGMDNGWTAEYWGVWMFESEERRCGCRKQDQKTTMDNRMTLACVSLSVS